MTEQITIRMTQEQRRKITEYAGEANLGMNAWRAKLFGGWRPGASADKFSQRVSPTRAQ